MNNKLINLEILCNNKLTNNLYNKESNRNKNKKSLKRQEEQTFKLMEGRI